MQDAFQLQIGDQRLDHQLADIVPLGQIVNADVELRALIQKLINERGDRFRFGRIAIAEVFQRDDVVGTGQHLANGRLTVAACPANFLHIAFSAFRQVVVIDSANIGLVDPHAEGDRGYHNHVVGRHERFLNLVAVIGRQAGVISAGREAALGQVIGDLIGGALQRDVDNRRSERPRFEPRREQPGPLAVDARRDA